MATPHTAAVHYAQVLGRRVAVHHVDVYGLMVGSRQTVSSKPGGGGLHPNIGNEGICRVLELSYDTPYLVQDSIDFVP